MNKDVRIGIIGGSGLYEMEALTDVENVSVETPFGLLRTAMSSAHWKVSGLAFFPGTAGVTVSFLRS